MPLSRFRRFAPRLRALAVVALAAAAVPLAGCRDMGDVTGSIGGAKTMPTDETQLRAYADDLGKRYSANEGAKAVSIDYARALRALTRYDEAVAVMQTAAVKAPRDFEVLGEYGKALADAGQLVQAKDVLSHSYPEERPSWEIMSVQGSVADRLGDHAAAIDFYQRALKIAPDEPRVLSNMGLSYALNKQLPEAEQALRHAIASPRADARMRGNLALVLGLEGKFDDAERVSLTDMSPEAARANVQAIRQMIAQNDSWRALQTGSKGKPRKAAPANKPLAGDGGPG